MKRKPKPTTTAFKVLALKTGGGRETFTRCGIEFGRIPQTVQREQLTEDQCVELLNTDTLFVEEIEASARKAARE